MLVESLPAEVWHQGPRAHQIAREDRRDRLRRIENYFVISPFLDLFLMQTTARHPVQNIEPHSAVWLVAVVVIGVEGFAVQEVEISKMQC